jgi:hypothetical protein
VVRAVMPATSELAGGRGRGQLEWLPG